MVKFIKVGNKKGLEKLVFAKPGKYVVFFFNFSGEVRIEIESKGVEVYIFGVFLGRGEDKFELKTIQNHKVGGSKSDLLVKSVLFDRAKFIYQGLIRIEKGAQKTFSYQKNQNLVLNKDVFVESRPFLEILADDVFCTHGSTTGRIDNEILFYLMSRGLDKKEAEKLIIEGFVNEVFDKMKEKVGGEITEQERKKVVEKLI